MAGEAKKKLDAAAQSALARFRRGKRQFSEAMSWPGGGEEMPRFVMGVLSCTETGQCRSEADHYFRSALGLNPSDLIHVDGYELEVATQILARGLFRVEEREDGPAIVARDAAGAPIPWALNATDIRDNTTEDERMAVFDAYSDFQRSVDPAPDELSPEMRRAIDEAVKKKDVAGTRAFGSRALTTYLHSLASPPSTSPTGSSASSSASSDPSTPSSKS